MSPASSFWFLPSLVTVIWGVNTVVVKLLTEYMPPLHVATYRMLIASILMLPVLVSLLRGTPVDRKSLLMAVSAGLLITCLHQIFLAEGVLRSKASIGSLILSLNPITTSLLAGRFVGESVTWRRVAGATLGFMGVAVAVLDDRWHTAATLKLGSGELIMALAMLTYVLGGLIVRKAAGRVSPNLFTALSHLSGTVALVGVFLMSGFYGKDDLLVPLPASLWVVLVISGLVATGLGGLMWNFTIQRWGAGRTSMFLNGLPITTMLAAAVWLGESVRLAQLLGLAAVVVGIALGTTTKRVSPRVYINHR